MAYYPSDKKNVVQEKLPILPAITASSAQTPNQPTTPVKNLKKTASQSKPWYTHLSDILQKSDSFLLQLLFAFLLGLLLSCTPCIYPMIPITIGILQVQGSKNIWYNFLLSLSYTVGIATTFALLGLLAAFTGQIFGNLMNNPWFVVTIVIMLAYFAGAMIGFYNLYIPTWLQPKNKTVHKGSFISAFLFGAISGTVASPCLSPGLILLLTMVSALSNLLLGFALLFAFGVGLGIPLLIIGTFSSSLSVLPRAGMWMVEIKEFLGFIMLGVCFYYLRTIIAWHVLLWMIALFLFATGLFYLYQAHKLHTKKVSFKNIVGILCIALSIFVSYKAVLETWWPEKLVHHGYWHTDYKHACTIAKQTNKLVLLDISAPFCSICKAIDKKIFQHSTVNARIQEFCIPIKIADFDTSNPLHANIKQQFNIMGVPSCCIINPHGEELCKFWGSELYDLSPSEFMQQLSEYACQYKVTDKK